MVLLNTHDSKPRKPLPRPRMLKDYLLNNLSSCSSNGFRSFPRRQCYLLENDLRTRDVNRRKRLHRSKSTNTSSAKSAFQHALEAVINAVKLLPFAVLRSPNASKGSKPKSSMLPSLLSRKILQRSFWKKADKDIERWTSFKYLLEERETPLPSPPDFSASSMTTTTATDSNSSINSKSESNSWSDDDFTSYYLPCSRGNSERSVENDVVEGERRLPEKAASKRIGEIVGDDSTEALTANSKNKWPFGGEKEQCSPASVLDVPFEEEEVSSPFSRRFSRMEASTNLKCHLINRNKTKAHAEDPKFCSDPIQDKINTKHTEVDLLELIKATFESSSFDFRAENLLLDFFREGICETNVESHYDRLLNEAKDLVDGPAPDMFLGWEVEKNRQAYIRDMAKGGRWSKLDADREDVALEVFASLMDEILLDLFS